jgi:hypothetical protein
MSDPIEVRRAERLQAPGLLRDTFRIIETDERPDEHATDMLAVLASEPQIAELIGERFDPKKVGEREELAYARAIVQNAAFQAVASSYSYVAGIGTSGKERLVGSRTTPSIAALNDALNVPTALRFMTNFIRHIKAHPSCADLSLHEISEQAADSITHLSRTLSSMSANQVGYVMKVATSPSWETTTEEWTLGKSDEGLDYLNIERDAKGVHMKETGAFTKLRAEARMQYLDSKDAVCPMTKTRGADDAYVLLLKALQLALKKIEDAKVKTGG